MRKQYKPKQKAQIVLELLKEERTVTQISSEYGIHTSQLYKWKNQALEGLPNLFEEDLKTEKALKAKHEKQLKDLYAEIGRLTTQLNWLKKKSGIEPIESWTAAVFGAQAPGDIPGNPGRIAERESLKLVLSASGSLR